MELTGVFLAVLALDSVLAVVGGADVCPEMCVCNDQNKVDCSNRGLDQIPQDMPYASTTLSLNDNQIKSIQEDQFVNLKSLEVLHLYANKLTDIHSKAFNGLTLLKRLILSQNQLKELPLGLFVGLENLVWLDISNNRLQTLPPMIFKDLFYLEYLEIWGNQLNYLPEETFKGLENLSLLMMGQNNFTRVPSLAFRYLPSLSTLKMDGLLLGRLDNEAFQYVTILRELYLGGNQIASIGNDTFRNLLKLESLDLSNNQLQTLTLSESALPKLRIFDLHDNPWMCDCRLLWLPGWLKGRSLADTVVTCGQPKPLQGRRLNNVALEDLTCPPPVIRVPPNRKSVKEGASIALPCEAKGDPPPTVRWITPNGKKVTSSNNDRMVVLDNGTLFISKATLDDRGDFTCIAENVNGQHDKATTKLWVKPKGGFMWSPTGGKTAPKKGETTSSRFLWTNVGIGIGSIVLCVVLLVVWKVMKKRKTHRDRNVDAKPMTMRNVTTVSGVSEVGSQYVNLPVGSGMVTIDRAGTIDRNHHRNIIDGTIDITQDEKPPYTITNADGLGLNHTTMNTFSMPDIHQHNNERINSSRSLTTFSTFDNAESGSMVATV
ncbi:leucine-rich repeat-containing protein 4B-like [Branchiostoma floridae]|nr:leucine-rich repeat-containing protein 4B-like [Branchiostoma floridae]